MAVLSELATIVTFSDSPRARPTKLASVIEVKSVELACVQSASTVGPVPARTTAKEVQNSDELISGKTMVVPSLSPSNWAMKMTTARPLRKPIMVDDEARRIIFAVTVVRRRSKR